MVALSQWEVMNVNVLSDNGVVFLVAWSVMVLYMLLEPVVV